MTTSRKRLRQALATALLLVGMLAVPPVGGTAPAVAASTSEVTAEQEFLALVNIERAKRGLGALRVRTDIVTVARRHSARMAAESRLHHNPNFSTEITGWQRVSENVGRGPSVSVLHAAFMDSDGHRRNIVDDRVTEVGIGVVIDGARIWVTVNFRRPSSNVSTLAPSTTTFGDVSSTSAHASSILRVASDGIAPACGTGRFCPTSSVTRAQFASMLVRALDLPAATRSHFGDVSGALAADVNALAEAGLTRGCGPDTFCPDQRLSREQLASFFANALELEPASSPFTDVGRTHAGSVGALYRAGITTGCGTTTYCPTQNVNRAQTASMLARNFG